MGAGASARALAAIRRPLKIAVRSGARAGRQDEVEVSLAPTAIIG
jgi:hypothetical protein